MSKKLILLVDDDVDFVAIQKEVLEKNGYATTTFHTAGDALKHLETSPNPDLIIVDLMIERDDAGFTFCHKIRKQEKTAQIPVLMLTGVRQARAMGFDLKSPEAREWIKANDLAEKPIRAENLLAKVRHLLGETTQTKGH